MALMLPSCSTNQHSSTHSPCPSRESGNHKFGIGGKFFLNLVEFLLKLNDDVKMIKVPLVEGY